MNEYEKPVLEVIKFDEIVTGEANPSDFETPVL